ncbi:MAG: AMP-binding protein [bacterium]|nr:AMP-binding protein [bacterium]
MNYNQTVPELFAQTVQRYPNKDAILFHGRFTYSDLDKMSDEFAKVLLMNGIYKGDRVSLLLPNSVHFDVAFLGILKIGAVVSAMNPLVSTPEILEMAKQAKPTMIITLDIAPFYAHNQAIYKSLKPNQIMMVCDLRDYFSPILKILYTLKTWRDKHFLGISSEDGRRSVYSWGYWKRDSLSQKYLLPDNPTMAALTKKNCPTPDDLAVLQSTGGTTGIPKFAMLSHRNIISNTLQALAHVNATGQLVTKDSIFLGVLPFFHVFGLSVCLNLAFAVGATVVIMPKFDSAEALKLIKKYGVDIFPAITRMYAALVAFGSKDSEKCRTMCASLRLCFSGAGALDLAVKAQWEKMTGKEITEGYGLSEASPIVSFNPIGEGKTGSMGTLVPDTELKLVHQDTGEPVGWDESGELWIRGPQVMMGYWQNEEETRMALREGGWLATGDIVRYHDGYLWFVDRKKDMVKINGENVYPKSIEDVIRTCPIVADVAVFGVPDKETGEQLVACVVLNDKAEGALKYTDSALTDAIHGHCRNNHLAGIKIPKRVVSVPEIPKTVVGKVLKRVLKENLLKN